MDLKKRHWLCFGYGWGALILGYLGFGQLHKFIFVDLLGFEGSFPRLFSFPYIYISTQSLNHLCMLIASYIFMAIGILFFIPWSLKLFNKARIYTKSSNELNLSDIPLKFPYVLYIRCFGFPQFTQALIKNAFLIEEEGIHVHFLSPIGKTVVIDNQSNAIPPLGGSRIYISDEEWQKSVKQLSKDANLTVLRIGETESFGWEIEYTLNNLSDLQKLIFLIPDIEKINLSFFDNLEKAVQQYRPNDVQITPCRYNKQGWGNVSSIIYFEKQENDSDDAPTYIMKQSMVPRRTIWNYFGNLSSAFQKALFPVYKQLGVQSFKKKLCNALFTYYFYILIPIFITCIFLFHLNPIQEQPLTSSDYSQAIHEAEQKYPKLDNILSQKAHEREREFMLDNGHWGSVFLSDEHLVEFAALDLQVYKKVYFNNYGIDRAVSQLSTKNAIKYNKYLLKSALIALNLEEPEYTSILTREEFQNQLSEVRSSLTEEQYETINKLLLARAEEPPQQFSLEQSYIDYLEVINKLPDKSIIAFLFRGYYIMKYSK